MNRFRAWVFAWIIAALLVVAVGGLWWPRTEPEEPLPPTLPEAVVETVPGILPREGHPAIPALSPPDPARLVDQPPHPEAAIIGTGTVSPEREIEIVWRFFAHFREQFGTFPTGAENHQFIFALQGRNPANTAIFPLDHPHLDADGNLLDPWGRPYFFHLLSRHALEIRSAGPDGDFYSEDDLVYP